MKYTEEDINKIIGLKGANGKLIDIFDLHGLLFVGNTKDGMWDLTTDGRYTRYSEHSIGLHISEFEDCETEEDVKEVFGKSLERRVIEELV